MFQNSLSEENPLLKSDNFYDIPEYMIEMLNSLYEDGDVNGIDDDSINENGRRFEIFIGELFRLSGFKVVVTPYLNDGGIDIYAKKAMTRYVIQVKKREPTKGGIKKQDVIDFSVATIYFPEYKKAKKILLTNHFFTTDAIELAEQQEFQSQYK